MSRLFDALKEATRSPQNATGTAGEGVWEALGLNGVERVTSAAESAKKRIDAGSSAPTAVLVEGLAGTPPRGGDVLGSIGAQQSRSLGIPATTALDKKARLIPNVADPIVVERYRMLRTKIVQEREKKPFRSLVIASPNPQEGKTVTVLNLALSFGMLPSFRVLLVDGDMRRGTLGEYLGANDNQPGLSNLLDGSAQLEDVVLKSNDFPMHFMVRGNSLVPDLQASHFSGHFRRMAEQYDLVLVDSPPVNTITDVQLLAASCDAVLLVARAFSTSRKALEQAVHNLQPFRLIGTVLNAGSAQRAHRYDGYY